MLAGACGHQAAGNGAPPAASGRPAPAATVPAALENDPPPPCLRIVPVAGSEALASSLGEARAGDCLVLADGEYTFPTIRKRGTAERPIVIRAQNRLGAVAASGDLEIADSAHVVVEGLCSAAAGRSPSRIRSTAGSAAAASAPPR